MADKMIVEVDAARLREGGAGAGPAHHLQPRLCVQLPGAPIPGPQLPAALPRLPHCRTPSGVSGGEGGCQHRHIFGYIPCPCIVYF